MMPPAQSPTLTVYGATGFTGRLVAAEAVRRGLPVVLAGRRRHALEALADELGDRSSVAVADATDPASLASLAARSAVLVSTVGPYARLGRPVVEAALAAGCHYLDVSGEVAFLEWVHEQTGRAAASGIALCPGFGFDGVPGDLLAVLAADEAPVRAVRVAYAVRHGRASAGTARSALGIARRGGAAWSDGRLVDEPVGAHRWRVPFPEPIGVRSALSIPAPEVVTVGRSTGAPTVRAYLVAAPASVLPPIARPLGAVTRAVARTPVWRGLERVVDRLPAGPDEAARARTRATVLVAVRGAQALRHGCARSGDPYEATAAVAVGVAARLLADGPPRTGTLTPSQAVGTDAGALLEAMGATWWVW